MLAGVEHRYQAGEGVLQASHSQGRAGGDRTGTEVYFQVQVQVPGGELLRGTERAGVRHDELPELRTRITLTAM